MGAPTEGILQVLETLDCPPRLTFRLFNGPAHYYHLPLEPGPTSEPSSRIHRFPQRRLGFLRSYQLVRLKELLRTTMTTDSSIFVV